MLWLLLLFALSRPSIGRFLAAGLVVLVVVVVVSLVRAG